MVHGLACVPLGMMGPSKLSAVNLDIMIRVRLFRIASCHYLPRKLIKHFRIGSFVTTSYNRDSFTLPLVEYIGCNGTEGMLSECTIDGFSNGYCNYPAEINCLVQPEFGLPGDLRLSENITSEESNRVSGRLEVYTNGAWGAVCSDSFGLQEARVACRQLGFSDQGKLCSLVSRRTLQGLSCHFTYSPGRA